MSLKDNHKTLRKEIQGYFHKVTRDTPAALELQVMNRAGVSTEKLWFNFTPDRPYRPPDESQRHKGQRGRLKRSKSRSLLERLVQFEQDVLRFMVEQDVPFTNNQGERDLRMSKVQQKVSGCFRSELGAKIFARNRSYLSTCRKNGVSSEEALRLLYGGRWPKFMGIAPE